MLRNSEYTFSEHARSRMFSRNISEENIDLVLRNGKRKRHGGKVIVTWRQYKVVLSSDETAIVTSYRKGR